MTDQELLAKLMRSDDCPWCESGLGKPESQDSGIAAGDHGKCILRWTCPGCGAQWQETYRLEEAFVDAEPDKATHLPQDHARDMNNALAKADAKARPWFTLGHVVTDDDGQPQ